MSGVGRPPKAPLAGAETALTKARAAQINVITSAIQLSETLDQRREAFRVAEALGVTRSRIGEAVGMTGARVGQIIAKSSNDPKSG